MVPALAPTQVPFNAILNAAAFSALGTPEEERRLAFKTAVATFSLMKKLSVPPDMITYGNMLKVVANLVPRGNTRTEMGIQLFQSCCQDGLVGDLVWDEARRALPTKVLMNLIRVEKPLGAIRRQDLPRSWTARLPRERRRQGSPTKRNKSKSKEKNEVQVKREPIRKFRNISEPSYESGKDV